MCYSSFYFLKSTTRLKWLDCFLPIQLLDSSTTSPINDLNKLLAIWHKPNITKIVIQKKNDEKTPNLGKTSQRKPHTEIPAFTNKSHKETDKPASKLRSFEHEIASFFLDSFFSLIENRYVFSVSYSVVTTHATDTVQYQGGSSN